MKQKLLNSMRVLLVTAGLCVGANAWAYEVPEGYEIKTVILGTDNGDGTVSALDFTSAESVSGWTADDGVTVSLGNITEVATVDVGSTVTTAATYVSGKCIQFDRAKKTTDPIGATYTFSAVSSGILVFNGDILNYGGQNTFHPNEIRFVDGDGNQVFRIAYDNADNANLKVYNSENTQLTSGCYSNYRSNKGYRIIDLAINLATGACTMTVDYTNNSSVRAQTAMNFNIGTGKSIAGLKINRYNNNNYDAKYHFYTYLDNVSLYTVDVSSSSTTYTVVAKAGETTLQTLATDVASEGDEYSVYLPRVIKKDGAFYEWSEYTSSTTDFHKTYTMGAESETRTINYTLSTDIVGYSEVGTGTTSTYSGGGISSTNANLASCTLDPGVYQADIKVISKAGSGSHTRNEGVYVGGTVVATTTTDATGLLSLPFLVTEDGTSVYVKGVASASSYNSDNLDYVIIRKKVVTDKVTTFSNLKTDADALAAVDNDNSSANSTLATAITTQVAAVKAATTESAITTATSTLLTAMNTYVAAANPTEGNKFALNYMLTDPAGETYTAWGAAGSFGWYTDVPTTDLGDNNNFVTRITSEDSWTQTKNGVERYTSNVCTTANTFALYQKVTLPAGNYSFDAYALANNASTIVMAAGSTEGDAVTAGSLTAYTVDFTQASSSEIKVGLKISSEGTNAANWMAIADLKLYKEAAVVSKTLTSAGWSTYCSPYILDFSSTIDGLNAAYIVTGGADGVLTKTEVTGAVPAGTGLLLKGTESASLSIPVAATATFSVTANKLVGVTASETLAANGGYVLMTSPSLAFYKNNNAFTLSANSAYLPANFDGGSARTSFSLFGNDETTSISEEFRVNSEEFATARFYNLQGQRVEKPTKGLFIVNGKKVIVK